jgi:hypothetical protein
MAKHRRPQTVRPFSLPGGRGVRMRGIVLVVILMTCAIGGIFSYVTTANSGAHADVLIGASGSRAPASARPSPAASIRSGPARTSAARSPTTQPRAVQPRAVEPSPAATPSASEQRVAGSSVTAVGESVMVASTPALEQDLPGIYIDAQVGRQFYTGLDVISALKARGLLRRIVVVGLGTNGTVTPAEISQLFAEIGPQRKLVLVNTFEARSWESEVNSALAAAARHYPNVALADWFTTIEHRTYLLWSDGIHPQPAGGIVYARILTAALDRAAALP